MASPHLTKRIRNDHTTKLEKKALLAILRRMIITSQNDDERESIKFFVVVAGLLNNNEADISVNGVTMAQQRMRSLAIFNSSLFP